MRLNLVDKVLVLFSLFAILLSGCGLGTGERNFCGDGICSSDTDEDKPDSTNYCPNDCITKTNEPPAMTPPTDGLGLPENGKEQERDFRPTIAQPEKRMAPLSQVISNPAPAQDMRIVDIDFFDGLPAEKKQAALAEAKALDKKYMAYWSDLAEQNIYGTNGTVKRSDYYASLKARWEKQKQFYLEEFALRKKYGVFFSGINYDQYIAETKAGWIEQEKTQPWNS